MRRAALISGFLMLGALWLGPLPGLARTAFWAHMTLHMGLVAVAAPLLALALSDSAADPVRRAPAWFPAVPLSLLELIVVWAWHTPALHAAARNTAAGFVAEQAGFLAAGLLLWLSAFGRDPLRPYDRTAAGIAALLLTSMHMTLLGALLALAPRPLYSAEACGTGMAALDDQHLGGAIMLLVGGIVYLAGGLGLTHTLVRVRRKPMPAEFA